MRPVNKIILHCSASKLPGQDAAMIDGWHRARGWAKIGYHYFIPTDGRTQEGRGLDEIGAHCEGENAASLGICLAGLSSFTPEQFKALSLLLAQLKPLYPLATVHAHNEFASAKKQGKTCPVFDIAPFKQEYEKELQCQKPTTFLDLLWKIYQLFFKRS